MLIELWRKVLADSYNTTYCSICGNEFDLGSVFPVAIGDHGEEVGEMCTVCLDYLNRRKEDADDPTLGSNWANWPARGWPTLEDLEEARRRYPEAMYANQRELEAAFTSPREEHDIYASSVLWGMERATYVGRED